MPPRTDHLHVISGGPGCGKTTLLMALAEAGHATVAESARAIFEVGWGNRIGGSGG